MGQIKPGIPVWMTGKESKFPNMPYIIFLEMWERLAHLENQLRY